MQKIIHYCWFGKSELPELAKKCINSWKKFFPDYEIKEWNESNFNINCNNYVSEAYKQKKYAFVSDYARLKIVYENGGIYFDTDVEVIKRFEPNFLIDGYFGFEGDYINTGLGFSAPKGSPILKTMMDDYENIHFIKSDGTCDLRACPERNTSSLRKNNYSFSKSRPYIDKIKIYSDEYFNPYDYRINKLLITKNTYSIHHCAASWISEEKRFYLEKKYQFIKKYGTFFGKLIYYSYRIGLNVKKRWDYAKKIR